MKIFFPILLILFPFIDFAQKPVSPFVINSIQKPGEYKISILTQTRRVVKYLGPITDTLHIISSGNDAAAIGGNSILSGTYNEEIFRSYRISKLNIYVNSKQPVTLDEYEITKQQRGYKYYKAYPIFITNASDSTTTVVGSGYHIPIALEVKNKFGEWKSFEPDYYIFDCGVGLEDIILKPGNVLCVFVPLFKGTIKTKLRYRLGNSFSNEFVGNVPKQFCYDCR